jgi:hypothetical protein
VVEISVFDGNIDLVMNYGKTFGQFMLSRG